MNRPYIAVVKDSFRAALANWVFYVMVGFILLFLLAIFPIGMKEELTSRIFDFEIIDAGSLSKKIIRDGESDRPSPGKRIWERLDEDDQAELKEVFGIDETRVTGEANTDEVMQQLQDRAQVFQMLLISLNKILEDREFYDEESWNDYAIGEEAEELLDVSNRSDEQSSRLNRLLINAAFSREIQEGPPTSLRLKYAIWSAGTAFPIRKQAVARQINNLIPRYLDWFVLSIGVFVAILVTAPVIPQMLEPGSLNLLLSKPVNRSALLLSKFAGACAFVLMCAVLLFVGLWFFFGLRLGIWNSAILLCIPLYVLVYAIYFAVTSLAGIVFRNTIVAIVISIIFWLVCFVLGITKGIGEGLLNKYEIESIVLAGDDVIEIDTKNVPYLWNDEKTNWETAFISEQNQQFVSLSYFIPGFKLPPMVGPIYDDEHQRLMTAQASILYADSPLATGHVLGIGQAEDDWQYQDSFLTPGMTVQMFLDPNNKDLLMVTRLGIIHRLKGDPVELMEQFEKKLEEESLIDDEPEGDTDVQGPSGGFAQPMGEDDELFFDVFEELGPDPPLGFTVPAVVTMNPVSGEILTISRSMIEIATRNEEGNFERLQNNSLMLPGHRDLTARVWFAGDTILVARGNGEIMRISRQTMKIETVYEPEANAAIRSLVGTDDGQWFGVVFDNGNLWTLNMQDASAMTKVKVRGQGKISAAAFDNNGGMWIADRVNRLRRYSLEDMDLEETRTPKAGIPEKLFRYGVIPMYVVCPKPGEFYHLVTHLSNSNVEDEDLERSTTSRRNPWAPFWNGLVFITVMLVLGCLYIERLDF